MAELPDDSDPKKLRDKFLVQSVAISEPPADQAALTALWKEKEAAHDPKQKVFAYQDQRVKCKLVLPSPKPNPETIKEEPEESPHSSIKESPSRSWPAPPAPEDTRTSTSPSSRSPPSKPTSSSNSKHINPDDYKQMLDKATKLERQINEHKTRENEAISRCSQAEEKCAELERRLRAALEAEKTKDRDLAGLRNRGVRETEATEGSADSSKGHVVSSPPSNGISFQIWQIILIAVIFFLAGRILSN
eukprot:CAMPEP_0175155196 /NCGR_PEP_ID=MMETSP0087-20121206/20829_1 /TAXON_ID=136419 /ORGANISM="Unknown Unknown, Strain D1" /LENGTH=246 /DNA_ID=CAMNT_0016442301 /DNA_START=164 /DNA_END=904 /DNA_ORIENTATION=+